MILERVKKMLGLTPKQPAVKPAINADISRAVQRNEIAATKAREALEELKMSVTMADIVGKMK